MILIDANIWAYYFDTTLSEHERVVKPLESSLKRGEAAVNSAIVVETLHYLVRRLGSLAGGEKGRTFLDYDMPLYVLDRDSLELTRKTLCELTHLGIGGRDASIIATMSQHGVTRIMTHDQAFKRVPDITVVDPV